MDGLEQCILVADVGGTGRAQSPGVLGGHIGDDVAVEVRQHNDLDALIEAGVKHLCAHGIYETLLNLDFGVFLAHLAHSLDEVAVHQLDDVRLGDDGDILLVVLAGKLKRSAGNALAALLRLHLEVNSQIVVDLNSLVAPDVLALDILAEERPVDILIRDTDGAHGGEQFQLTAQQAVGTNQIRQAVARTGRYHRAFQQHIALLDLGQHFRRQALQLGNAVFDRHTLDFADLHLAALDFGRSQYTQHTQCLLHNDGTDAVAGQDANDDFLFRRKVGGLFRLLHPLNTGGLVLDQFAELFLCGKNIFRVDAHFSASCAASCFFR